MPQRHGLIYLGRESGTGARRFARDQKQFAAHGKGVANADNAITPRLPRDQYGIACAKILKQHPAIVPQKPAVLPRCKRIMETYVARRIPPQDEAH